MCKEAMEINNDRFESEAKKLHDQCTILVDTNNQKEQCGCICNLNTLPFIVELKGEVARTFLEYDRKKQDDEIEQSAELSTEPIKYMKLDFDSTINYENLLKCNFKDKDGSDPLEVDHFAHRLIPTYIEKNLCNVYLAEYEKQIIGFFTTSTGTIEVENLIERDRELRRNSYPALLLGNMGIDQKFRSRGFGTMMYKYFENMAIEAGKKIGFGYIYLQTNWKKKSFYESFGFITTVKEDNGKRFTMYMRLPRKIRRELAENISSNDHVAKTKTIVRNLLG